MSRDGLLLIYWMDYHLKLISPYSSSSIMVGIIVLMFYVLLIYWNYLVKMWKYVHYINLKFQFVGVSYSMPCYPPQWKTTLTWPLGIQLMQSIDLGQTKVYRSEKCILVSDWSRVFAPSSDWLSLWASGPSLTVSPCHMSYRNGKKRVGRNLKSKTTHNRLQGCGLLCNTSCFFKVKQQMKRKRLSSDQIVKIKRIM